MSQVSFHCIRVVYSDIFTKQSNNSQTIANIFFSFLRFGAKHRNNSFRYLLYSPCDDEICEKFGRTADTYHNRF